MSEKRGASRAVPSSRSMALLMVVGAAILFGTTGTAKAFAPSEASAWSVGMARIVIGGLVLGATGVFFSLRAHRSRVVRATRGVGAWMIAIVGAVGVVAYQPAFFWGTSLNGVAVSTVVTLGAAPVATGILSWILGDGVPRGPWWWATFLAVAGVTLIAEPWDSSFRLSVWGLLSSLAAGVSYAVYTVAAKALLQRGWSASASMGAVFGAAAILALPLLLTSGLKWMGEASGVVVALWLGLGATAAAYVLFGRGLVSLSAPTVATVTLVEPLTASLLGVLVLGERLPTSAMFGILAVVAGIAMIGALPGSRSSRISLRRCSRGPRGRAQ